MCKGGCEIGVMICILVTGLMNLRVRARALKDLDSSIYMTPLICTRRLPNFTWRRQTPAITAAKYAAVSAVVFSFDGEAL